MFSRDTKARRAVEELEERFTKLEREFRSLQMEWENAYDKMRTMMGRVSKRAEILQKEMDGGKPPLSPEEEVLAEGSNHQTFSARQKLLQQAILRRRAGL